MVQTLLTVFLSPLALLAGVVTAAVVWGMAQDWLNRR